MEGLLTDLLDAELSAHYVNAALEDPEDMLLLALRDIAEARRMSKIADSANVSREALYRMLSEEGKPRLRNLVSILRALGLRLSIEAIGTR